MQIGIFLGSTRYSAAPEIARRAEDLGFQAVWAPEHLIGGETPPALRRAARFGDGWIGMGNSPEKTAEYVARLRTLRAEYGRTGEFQVIVSAGQPDLDTVRRYADAGVTGLYVSLWRRTAEAPDALARYADTVLSRLPDA